MVEVKGKKIVVVGAGRSGIAAARLAAIKGAKVKLLEKQKDIIDGEIRKNLLSMDVEIKEGEHDKRDFEDVDIVVLSPGVAIHSIKEFIPEHIPVISELEFGFWHIRDEFIIAITGTNGKTTTVGLISYIFDQLNIKHFVGGNFGTPLCEYFLNEKKPNILLEVSSFQLQNIKKFRPNIAVFLNFDANHLDYHKDLDEYFSCKMNIFKNQSYNDIAIINEKLKESISKYNVKSQIKYFTKSNIKLKNLVGEHNLENIQAAYLVCDHLKINQQTFKEVAEGFKPFAHRIEFVREINGIRFYNDSKSTTLASMEAAIKSFENKILLIVGGIFKGGDAKKLIPVIKQRVKEVCCIGKDRDIFYDLWKDVVSIHKAKDIRDATKYLYSKAEKGDIILLSPGCSSFDMFTSYKERGDYFKQIVNELS